MLTFKILAEITGGEWIIPPENPDDALAAIFDDSRNVAPGAIFAAIKGEITDGHRYVTTAAEAGAAGIIVDTPLSEETLNTLQDHQCPLLMVANSLKAFQQLARHHLEEYPNLPIIALTGSSGKTSTKEMCAAILARRWTHGVLKTLGNTNNHFGVPRNILRINEGTRAAVIEMGTNHPGEIANLVQMAPPTVGLVSNIGQAHLEFFHDLNGVANEKGDILAGIRPDGTAVFCTESAGKAILREKAGQRKILTFGTSDDADVQFTYLGRVNDSFRMRLYWKNTGTVREISWTIGGEHMASNAAAAAAATTALGLTPDEIADGLEHCILPAQRQELLEVDGIHWVNDSYNSNPDSCCASIACFSETAPKCSPKVIVLGDMLELGEHSTESHCKILKYAQDTCPDAQLVTVGTQLMTAAHDMALTGILSADNVDEAQEMLQELLREGTWILLKGSHGIHLEKLCPKASR